MAKKRVSPSQGGQFFSLCGPGFPASFPVAISIKEGEKMEEKVNLAPAKK